MRAVIIGAEGTPNVGPGGSICLSLLNTWKGDKNECWLPRFSTILQVLVSIQGLVLTANPFSNAPGNGGFWRSLNPDVIMRRCSMIHYGQ